jgi:hypothetical protein
MVACGSIGETGVDEQVAAVLRCRDGSLGVVKAAIRTAMACTARVAGTDGWIDVPAFMHCPDAITVNAPGRVERVEAGFPGDGLRFQIAEVQECIAAGRLESSGMSLDESVSIARTLDTLRGQIGVVYPGE